jgi:hypothetical protein
MNQGVSIHDDIGAKNRPHWAAKETWDIAAETWNIAAETWNIAAH